MNKRDFLVQGGALASTVAGRASWADRAPGEAASPSAAEPTKSTPGGWQARWQALQGERFSGLTALGRPVELVLSEVIPRTPTAAVQAPGAEQFTVSFEGPRALPLQAGLHRLNHPAAGTVQLYLEPVSHGERIGYDAHFSLLGRRA